MLSALQAIGWAIRPLPFMQRSRERYGDIFTLHIRHGRQWVLGDLRGPTVAVDLVEYSLQLSDVDDVLHRVHVHGDHVLCRERGACVLLDPSSQLIHADL
jgi:hypothetical protein